MLFQQMINGLTLGSTYALIALGYTMVYGIIQLINFAHGEIFMVGAFIGLLMISKYHLNVILAMFASMAVTMLLGIVAEKIAYKPLRKASRLSALISAIGVSIFLQTVVLIIRGPQTAGMPKAFDIVNYNIGQAQISNLQLFIIFVAALLMVTLTLIVKYTKIGKAMRATSQDYDTASLMGINVSTVISFTFALGSALAAAGGVLFGLLYNALNPYMGLNIGLKAFAAAVLGGIGSIPGAMLGGILLGVAEIMAVAMKYSSYRDAIAFTILILVLLVKPTGLLGRKIQKKV